MKKKFNILFIICLMVIGLSISVHATSDSTEIKVGYVSNYGTLKAAYSEGSEGYGYEYLTNLINYMDGDYTLTFVSCSSWQDGLTKLDNGEIDILGPTIKSENSDYIYSANDFGHCTMMLAALSGDSSVVVNTTSLDGVTIGIPDYYLEHQSLTDFLETEGIEATLVTVPSQDLNITMGLKDIDYIWMSPLIYEESEGQLEGVAFTLLDILSESADITFEYVMLDDSATEEDFASADFFIAATDLTVSLGFPYESNTYLELPFMLLEHRETSSIDVSDQRIGVADYYRTDSLLQDGTLYGCEVVKYATVQELQQSFDAGEIDCMLITVVSLNMIRDQFETQDFIASTVEDMLQLSFAFSKQLSAEEIIVFNKLIATVDQNALDAALLQYTITNGGTSLQAILADNPWILVNCIIVILLIIAITSIFFLIKRRREVAHTMHVDSITGIMTEYKFIIEARKILKEDDTGSYRLVTLDIDNFKYINEIYGYEIGTALLKIVGQCMCNQASKDTIMARGTADRFMVLAPMVDYQQAAAWIEADINAIHTALRALIGKAYKLHFSMGMYEICDRAYDITVMLDYANIARQQGKLRAGTSISVFTPQMQKETVNNNHFTSIMEQALEDEEFILHYQPKVNLQTGRLAGAEVLVRWQRAAECMPPYHFIPLFEKNGFIEEMDYYVLSKSCVFLKQHPSLMQGRVSVNLSGVTILQEQVVQNIVAILEKHQIMPTQLDLEITETAFVDSSSMLEKIQELRRRGFTISMDDFGAGVSSLNRLKNIHVDTLKIDREFIIDAIENPRGNQILQRVIQMAEDLQLETVAEGIETLEQSTLLQNLGCQIGQGYYYARPMAEEEFIVYCQSHNV